MSDLAIVPDAGNPLNSLSQSPSVWGVSEVRGARSGVPPLHVISNDATPVPPTLVTEVPRDLVSDDELIAALAAGESAALGPLYDRHAPPIFSLLLRILGDRATAEDLLQDVFLRAWQQAHLFDETRGNARAWLFCMAHSMALNEIRRRRRRPVSQSVSRGAGEDARDPYRDLVDPALDPAQDACSAVRDSAVARALAMIPEAQQEVLTLYAAGFSQSEIAERLGEPLGTIKSRMRRGLGHLRESLTTAGVETG